MNIFAYDPDPRLCALWIDDVRLNKMLTEHGQMLTAVFDYRKPNWFMSEYPEARINYPSSVMNHPCTKWLRESWANVRWLVELNDHMFNLWLQPHKSVRIMPAAFAACRSFGVDDVMTPFANAARSKRHGLDFTHIPDTHKAYRLYHCARWSLDNPAPRWHKGFKPEWYGG